MKKAVILIGPPGSGKGTQAELLAEKFGFSHFESSKVLESCFGAENPEKIFEIEGKKYKVKDEIKRWQTGLLNSPPFVVNLFLQKIKDLANEDKSIVFSGSPRTVYEAERELPVLGQLYGKKNIKLVTLEIAPETTVSRNSHRKICELMRHSILFNAETEKLTFCPLDGSKLLKRKDLDDISTIRKRIEVFKEETLPVIEVAEKFGIKAHKVDGEQSVADVYRDILAAIK